MGAVDLRYALVTPARNEAAFLVLTIRSMIAQTRRPLKWVIVNDGSTDATEEVARAESAGHDWIEVLSLPVGARRDFAGKVGAFNAGYARLDGLDCDIVGSLDADISFEPDYFEFLLGKFAADPGLGVGGTPFSENGRVYDYRYSSIEYVSGACQLFRRECFRAIGGYVPMAGGGIDVVAVMTARMKGWRTRTFPEKVCIHHRPMSSANHDRVWLARFKQGERAYRTGFHPLWQVFRSIYQSTKRPYVMGGCALFAGYFWALLRREPQIPADVVRFQRQDQMRRLREFLLGLFRPRRVL